MEEKREKAAVAVVGGGLSGVAAAVAAAREGADVLLIEREGFLGGMATLALVNPFMSYTTYKGRWDEDWAHIVNKGIFQSILEEMGAMGGMHPNRVTFNEEILKLVLDGLLKKHGVRVLLHTQLVRALRDGRTLRSVQVVNRSGFARVEANVFIDATGNADLCALAGCACRVGREEDGLCQPMTLCFRVGNVDTETFDAPSVREQMEAKYKELRAAGRIKNPREDILVFPHVCGGVVHFNSTRVVGKSPLDAWEYTEAEMEARAQMYELFRFLKENVAGFENSTLLMSGSQLGIRESRRVVGLYTITQNDLLRAVKFEDSVARGTYPVDIHNPSGTGTVLHDIPYGDYYTIPYRALIPAETDNLLVCGRPISSTHEAHAAYRVMPICCCIGEGAGTAASLALQQKVAVNEVRSRDIHALLDQNGALY